MTVADVIADGPARAGAARVFVDSGTTGLGAVLDAFRRRGLAVVRAGDAGSACVMGAVSGGLVAAPGIAVIGNDRAGAVEGLAYALRERLPLVVITVAPGAGPSSDEAIAPSRADLAGVTKATLAVEPESASRWIAHACQLALTEPWGPVHLAVPAEVTVAAASSVTAACRPAPPPAPDAAALDRAADLLGAAERPLVVVGRLCRSEGAGAWVRAFAEARPAPILVTPGARGVVPDPHPLVIGTLPPGRAERELIESADLVVGIGLDPDESRPPAWPARTAVLHLTPTASVSPGSEAVVAGDIGLILEELAPRLRARRLAEWDVARLHALRQAAAAPPVDPESAAAYRLVATARRLMPAGAIAVFAGEGLASASLAWPAVERDECVLPGGGTGAGLALCAAVATQLGRPERRIVCFATAAALAARPGALGTALALGAPVLTVVVGDSTGGALAAPAGLARLAADAPAGFGETFARAAAAGAPALVDARRGTATKGG